MLKKASATHPADAIEVGDGANVTGDLGVVGPLELRIEYWNDISVVIQGTANLFVNPIVHIVVCFASKQQ